MRHSLYAEEFGIRLRPVRSDDAPFIVWLRNLEHVRGRVGDSAITVQGQEKWLATYFQRGGDYYFIAETQAGTLLGTHGIYGVQGVTGEKGRQVVRPEVLCGVPIAMLATDLAFVKLGLTQLRSTTVISNTSVRSLHLKSGFKQVGIIPSAVTIDGRVTDLVEFLLTPEDWFKARDSLIPAAQMAGRLTLEWEASRFSRLESWNSSRNGK